MGMEQCKLLDQYLTSGIVSTRSIQKVQEISNSKNFKDFSVKFQSP